MAYSPTTYFFDEKKWLKEKLKESACYKQSGLIIGNLLRGIDEDCQKLLKDNGQLSEDELMMFQAIYTTKLFSDIEAGRGPSSDKINQTFEVICDGTLLLLKTALSEFSGQKSYDVYLSLLELSSKRIYLEEKWKKIENKRLMLEDLHGDYRFLTCDMELDFGETIAVERFQDHMNQLRAGFDPGKNFVDFRIRAIPSKIDISMNGLQIEYIEPNETFYKQSYLLLCQIKFYYKEFVNFNFKNYDEVTVLDLSVFWLVFSNLSSVFLEALNKHVYKGVYYSFSDYELVEILLRCSKFGRRKSEQIISLFTNDKTTNKKSDLYVKPLYKTNENIHLCLPALLTGQFTRVVDFYVSKEVEPSVDKKKTQNKGRFFELEFERILTEQIAGNRVLSDTFCKILKVGFKQERGKDNEEADIVLRIGETYLVIESKSFVYRVGSTGFKNNVEKIRESDLGRKRQFFIDEYQRFKESFDPSACFELDSEKVIACYLSSSPHCVGMTINGFPVVDSSILERYFGNAGFGLVNPTKGEKEFRLYKDASEAELNLKRYLVELPQLYHYKECFDYSISEFPDFYNGKEVKFSEPFFDFFNEARVQTNLDVLWEMADKWHSLDNASKG